MSILNIGPNIQGIGTAIDNAAKTIRDPSSTVPLEDVAKKLVTDIAAALSPNSNPNVTINKLINNGIDEKTSFALGAHMAIFKMGLDLAFSGVPGLDKKNTFTDLLMKAAGPQLEQALKNANLPADEIFRHWKVA